MKRLVLIGVCMATAVSAVTAAYAAPSPKAVLNSILAAARAEHSVHWTEHDVIGGALISSSADVGVQSGKQKVVFRVGKQKGTIHIVFVGSTAYVEGDAFGLEANLGLTKAQATKYAGKWISIPKGDKLYAPVSGGLTVDSVVTGLTLRGKLKTERRTVHRVRVVVVEAKSGTGKKERAGSLAAHATGKPLPIAEITVAPRREFLGRIDFSKWNESVAVQAPANSIPIATVRGS